ncbi:3-oxoacyl-ACP reductase family protein [Thalassospira sp. A3_1]|uniref:SDR family NAD(P)-dependent oxidoreductase n=1 Tax=Thalassospira sp. A3_1 TaxID=2821088 RepID=UPI001AD97FA7|nr:3-oxoacyl-ACP reductase family protein [Thalassospira sp. A3_1]MBO9506348.1 3-oxoacyl-ACP reductase FabG [Thalassospira sp. A3_1]
MQNLAGKVAFVTGGSRGIGAAIAKRLAREGAKVAITYVSAPDRARDVVGEIEAAGGVALAIKADNRKAQEVEAAINEAAAKFGRIDILVNNAGIIEMAPVDELSIEQFDRTVDVNVRAVFVATKAALAHMPDGGRIITTGSNLAHQVPWPGLSLYALSKSALIGFTRGAARDLGPRKITVNVVHPGPTDTDMNPAEGDIADAARSTMAIPDYSDANDTAGLVAWLAGPEAKVVTGSEFTVDSGMNA